MLVKDDAGEAWQRYKGTFDGLAVIVDSVAEFPGGPDWLQKAQELIFRAGYQHGKSIVFNSLLDELHGMGRSRIARALEKTESRRGLVDFSNAPVTEPPPYARRSVNEP